MENEDKDYYWAGQLGEAAALSVLGHQLVELRTNIYKRTQFGFVTTAELSRDMASYWANKLKVDARSYQNMINELRKKRWDYENPDSGNINNSKN